MRKIVPVQVRLEDFEFTRCDHHGDILLAAGRLGVKPATLVRALYRARARGMAVGGFVDNSERVRTRVRRKP